MLYQGGDTVRVVGTVSRFPEEYSHRGTVMGRKEGRIEEYIFVLRHDNSGDDTKYVHNGKTKM